MKIREATVSDAAAIALVHVESWRSTYSGIIPDDVLANLSYEERRQMWHGAMSDTINRRFVWVAETREGEIVGFAAAGPEHSGEYPYEGELYAIYLFQDYQGMGIDRDLVMAIVQDLLEAGMSSLMVWVLDENPACSFYAALGGFQEYEEEINIGGAVLKEFGFGWRDLKELIT